MPANYTLSWEPTRRRWWKMYRGQRYVVSCRQLDAPESKEGSYQAANAWWKLKRAEIDSQRSGDPEILEQRRRVQWAEENDRNDLIPDLKAKIRTLKRELESIQSDLSSPVVIGPNEDIKDLYYRLIKVTATLKEQIDFTPVVEYVRKENEWNERLKPPLDPSVALYERSVAKQVSQWLESLKEQVQAKQFSLGVFKSLSTEINHFIRHFGSGTPIDEINEETWNGFYRSLVKRIGLEKMEPGYAKRVHSAARLFVEYLVSLKRIPALGNLSTRRTKFTVPKKEIQVFERDEITALLSESTRDIVRLFVLLGLNCGMTQQDISDLRPDEINWDTGVLSRKRSKTENRASTPKVSYVLWPETLELLVKLRSADPEHVLLTRTGREWVSRGERNTDSVRVEFDKLKARLPFKHLRKTAATTLAEHPEYTQFAQHFLGHTPSTMAEIHYVRPSQDRFDLAIRWLREQFLSEVPVA